MKTRYIAIILLVTILATLYIGYTAGVLTTQKTIESSAAIVTDVNIAVYESNVATEELTFIGWGNMLPSQIKEVGIWIENLAEIPLAINITTTNWSPEWAEQSITLETYVESWDNYPILEPHDKRAVILKLTAGENSLAGAFSFTIIVSGSSL